MEKMIHRLCMYLAISAILCLVLWKGEVKEACAASATINIEASENQIGVGDSFYIIITIQSDNVIGDVDAYFNYDDKKLEFVTGGSIAANENKLIHIKDTVSDADYTKKYSIEFKARKRGTADIALLSPFKILEAEGGESMSASSNRLSLYIGKEGSGSAALPSETETGNEIEEPEGGSTDMPEESTPEPVNKRGAKLASLSISPQLLSPEFQPGHYRYETTVASDITELDVFYTTYETDSYVEVSGNQDFVTGRNLVKIKVIGADGYTKTYKIAVTKTAEEPEQENASSTEEEESKEEEGETVHSSVTKVYTKDEYQATVTQLRLIIGILTASVFFLLVIVISLILRLKGYKEDGLDDV